MHHDNEGDDALKHYAALKGLAKAPGIQVGCQRSNRPATRFCAMRVNGVMENIHLMNVTVAEVRGTHRVAHSPA